MLLGTLLDELQNESTAISLLEATGDLVLLARISAMAGEYGETSGEYAANAAARFAVAASDECWLSLMTKLERSENDPARACLEHMIDWALKRDAEPMKAGGCTCGGHHGADDGHGHEHEGHAHG